MAVIVGRIVIDLSTDIEDIMRYPGDKCAYVVGVNLVSKISNWFDFCIFSFRL